MRRFCLALLAPALLLSACERSKEEAAEERVERAAEASAAASGPAIVALGLTEAQLIQADLIGPGNVELGDVTSLSRGADGQVDRLLIEIEDSNPDRFVYVPITGLTVISRGDDRDLSTTMTREALAALPDAQIGAATR